MLMLQADTVRSALENPTRSWLFWIDQLLLLCGCAAIRKAYPFQPQTNGSQNRFAIPAIISLVSMAMTARLQNGYYQDEINGAFLFYFSAVLLFADVMTFVLIVWNEKDERLKGENLTLTARARTQAESIEALSASYAAQRKLTHTVICFQAFTFIEVNCQHPMPTEQLDGGSDKVFHPFRVQHTGIQADVQRNISRMAAGSFVQFHPAASSVPKSPKVSCSSSTGFGAGLGAAFLDFSFLPALVAFPL